MKSGSSKLLSVVSYREHQTSSNDGVVEAAHASFYHSSRQCTPTAAAQAAITDTGTAVPGERGQVFGWSITVVQATKVTGMCRTLVYHSALRMYNREDTDTNNNTTAMHVVVLLIQMRYSKLSSRPTHLSPVFLGHVRVNHRDHDPLVHLLSPSLFHSQPCQHRSC